MYKDNMKQIEVHSGRNRMNQKLYCYLEKYSESVCDYEEAKIIILNIHFWGIMNIFQHNMKSLAAPDCTCDDLTVPFL
jgi:hypothetical protein